MEEPKQLTKLGLLHRKVIGQEYYTRKLEQLTPKDLDTLLMYFEGYTAVEEMLHWHIESSSQFKKPSETPTESPQDISPRIRIRPLLEETVTLAKDVETTIYVKAKQYEQVDPYYYTESGLSQFWRTQLGILREELLGEQYLRKDIWESLIILQEFLFILDYLIFTKVNTLYHQSLMYAYEDKEKAFMKEKLGHDRFISWFPKRQKTLRYLESMYAYDPSVS